MVWACGRIRFTLWLGPGLKLLLALNIELWLVLVLGYVLEYG
jgi:hypothetical protein